jgi:hypothetical protein
LVSGLEESLDIQVGVLAVVPNRYKATNDQDRFLERIRADGWEIPVKLRERSSLLEGCWAEQCTAYRYIDEHRSRERDYELDTLEKFDKLAEHVARKREVKA